MPANKGRRHRGGLVLMMALSAACDIGNVDAGDAWEDQGAEEATLDEDSQDELAASDRPRHCRSAEVCDGRDNDCDGLVDEGAVCCVAKTCASAGMSCGAMDDGCGRALDCGACPPACGDGQCNGVEDCQSCPGDCGVCPPAEPKPYSGTPLAIPGIIEAEDFDVGGEGVAYHDTTAGNLYGVDRDTDVDVGTCSDATGGSRVGYVFPGEWLHYSVQVASSGNYTLAIRYATTGTGASMHVEIDGASVGGAMALPSTGSWSVWATFETTLTLAQGQHFFKVFADAGNMDFNYFKLTAAAPVTPPPPAPGSGVGTGTTYAPAYVNVTGGGAFPSLVGAITASCTGLADATSCLQAALNQAHTANKPLLIPYSATPYRVTAMLIAYTSVIGTGAGMPTLKNDMSGASGDNSLFQLPRSFAGGWISNLHLIGNLDKVTSGERAHLIVLRGANNVTIKGNLLESTRGDAVADGGSCFGYGTTNSNVLIDGNTIVNPYRCAVSWTGQSDRWAVLNNSVTYTSRYVVPFDLEGTGWPDLEDALITNVEIAYNKIESAGARYCCSLSTGFYRSIVSVDAYSDRSPGGNIWAHHNYGNWGVPFYYEGGYQGSATSPWVNTMEFSNTAGDSVPTP